MTKKTKKSEEGADMGLGGFLSGLGTLLEKLGELAEKGEELRHTGELRDLGPKDKVRGVYGFTIKTGLGGEPSVKVEPFGNVHKDEQTGKTVVDEVREPAVDVFEEADGVVVVAEMPGIGEEDARLELAEDVLSISAARGDKKYRKEVLLPAAFSAEQMSHTCRNGVLEVKLTRQRRKEGSV